MSEVSCQLEQATQRVVVSGENAAAYRAQVEAGFGANLPDGMKRIALAMERAEDSVPSSPHVTDDESDED